MVNSMLKREQEEEFLLTELLDPVVFLERFTKINTSEGIIDFNLEKYQKKVARDSSRLRVVNKSRKIGMSTLVAGMNLHSAIVEPRLDNMVISTGEKVAEELLAKIYDMLFTMPVELQPYAGQIGERQRMDIMQFSNRSRIMSLPVSSKTLRGYGLKGKTNVWADEFAMMMTREPDMWDVIRGFMILGGNMTMISTPLGRSGRFYEIGGPLQSVYRGEKPKSLKPSIWSYHEIPYTKCDRLVKQFDEGILTMDTGIKLDKNEAEFRREFLCEYTEEGLSFFPYPMLYACADVKNLHPSGYKSKDGVIYIGVDIAKVQDETAITVFEKDKDGNFIVRNVETMSAKGMENEGAGFYNEVEKTISMFNKLYEPVAIKIDKTGPGEAVFDHLYGIEGLGSKVWGYDLSNPFKEKIIVNLRMLFERKKIRIPEEIIPIGAKLISQLHATEKTGTESGLHSKYSGKETGLDDLVWSVALCVYEEFQDSGEPFFEVVSDPELTRLGNLQSEFNREGVEILSEEEL